MSKNDINLKSAEDLVRSVLSKNFGQSLDSERLRRAAEKLCDSIPQKRAA